MAASSGADPPGNDGLDSFQFTFSCSSRKKSTSVASTKDSFIEPDVCFTGLMLLLLFRNLLTNYKVDDR